MKTQEFEDSKNANIRGHWIIHHSGGFFCSVCGRWIPDYEKPLFCQHCHSEMDLSIEEKDI